MNTTASPEKIRTVIATSAVIIFIIVRLCMLLQELEQTEKYYQTMIMLLATLPLAAAVLISSVRKNTKK